MIFNGLVPRADGTGLDEWADGVLVGGRDFTAGELAAIAEAQTESVAAAQAGAALSATRQALTDAVQLAALSPYPTPEEQAIIDAQVSGSLALFRALADPPADVTALAAAVLTLEVQR